MSGLNNVVIVGSGPSGVSAALAFSRKGIVPLILDVGHTPGHVPSDIGNIYEYRKKHDTFDLLIGRNLEGLYNVFHKTRMSPKLILPDFAYVTRDAERISPVTEKGFKVIQSFAAGGLASAWGAGLFRYNDDDLAGTPLTYAQLEPYYDLLTKEIGIIGKDDDLTPFFGPARYHQRPLHFSAKSALLFQRYKRHRRSLNRRGVFLGYPRLGVISQDLSGRKACDYSHAEGWVPNSPCVYNPTFTLKRLIAEKRVRYESGLCVRSWSREKGELCIHATEIKNGARRVIKTRCLFLAAGTVNTAKIVLQSRRDHRSELPLLDNPLIQVPMFFPGFLGSRLESEAFSMGQLSAVFDVRKYGLCLQGGILDLTLPPRSVFFEQLPFSAGNNIRFIRLGMNAFLVMLLFFPSSPDNAAALRLRSNGVLEVRCPPYRLDGRPVGYILRALRKLGIWSSRLFISSSPAGYGIHYGGSLPMSQNSKGPYGCTPLGELNAESGVFVVDGSVLPHIAAKNLSLTIMANAMRTADLASERILSPQLSESRQGKMGYSK